VELSRLVFPHLAGLRITDVFTKGSVLRVHAETCSQSARCPDCAAPSRRVHSRYERRLLDAAVGERETVLHLRVRRFFCTAVECARKIFCEQVDGLTTRHGRISALARRLLEAVAVALGGRAGARLADRLRLGVGRMSMLRLIRALPLPPVPALTALGVDDFAWRRGHRYGTVLVDMLTHRVVDLLDDRSSESLQVWLADHTGIEVICRDRSGTYAEAAQVAAPAATQVADRWHLLKNLSDAVYKAVARHRRCLQPAPAPPPPPSPQPSSSAMDSLRTQRTRARHAEIHALREQGLGVYVIARRLRLDPKTVRRYADVADPETLIGPNGTARISILDTHKPYLRQRCADGVTGTLQLLGEIRARGYTGGERTLRRFLIAVRGRPEPTLDPPPVPPTRDITGWIMRPGDKLTDDERTDLDRLCGLCPDLASIRDLAHGFTDLVRTRGGEHLTDWVRRAEQSTITEIRSFAAGLRKDWAAVTAGLTTTWSSGAVEGNVNRIKMLKRQMYGRANPDLLRRRVLLTT
jgi:transposase